MDWYKIFRFWSRTIQFRAEQFHTCDNVHLLLPSSLRAKHSKGYSTYETVDNYSTNGAIRHTDNICFAELSARLQDSDALGDHNIHRKFNDEFLSVL